MLLYSRKKVRYRRDGYCWKKRKDGKTTREDHMKLKVQGMEVIGFSGFFFSFPFFYLIPFVRSFYTYWGGLRLVLGVYIFLDNCSLQKSQLK